MCSLGLWRHSISIGYSASIKSSMKGRQSGDTPDPLSPHQPPGTPPTPLRTPLHPSPLAPLPSAASSRPGCQVMKFDLFIGTLGWTVLCQLWAAAEPQLLRTRRFFPSHKVSPAKQFPLLRPPGVASVAAGVSLYRKVDPIAPSFIM